MRLVYDGRAILAGVYDMDKLVPGSFNACVAGDEDGERVGGRIALNNDGELSRRLELWAVAKPKRTAEPPLRFRLEFEPSCTASSPLINCGDFGLVRLADGGSFCFVFSDIEPGVVGFALGLGAA